MKLSIYAPIARCSTWLQEKRQGPCCRRPPLLQGNAIDYVPALLEEGRERAVVEGLQVDFREGDAEDIPFPDASFDYVLSTIGVMFAPDQEKAASELLRVCRSGGKIGLASWTPDGYLGEFFKTI